MANLDNVGWDMNEKTLKINVSNFGHDIRIRPQTHTYTQCDRRLSKHLFQQKKEKICQNTENIKCRIVSMDDFMYICLFIYGKFDSNNSKWLWSFGSVPMFKMIYAPKTFYLHCNQIVLVGRRYRTECICFCNLKF